MAWAVAPANGVTITNAVLAPLYAQFATWQGNVNGGGYALSAVSLNATSALVEGPLRIRGAAGTTRDLAFQTLGSTRFRFVVDEAPESGSNAGSDMTLLRYSDAGTILGTAININRATGNIVMPGSVDCHRQILVRQGLDIAARLGTPQPAVGVANLYVKGNFLVVQFRDGATVRYKCLELAGTGTAWIHTLIAP